MARQIKTPPARQEDFLWRAALYPDPVVADDEIQAAAAGLEPDTGYVPLVMYERLEGRPLRREQEGGSSMAHVIIAALCIFILIAVVVISMQLTDIQEILRGFRRRGKDFKW